MKKLILISILIGAMPILAQAQDDDLYFVPKKKATEKLSTDKYGLPKDTYYAGSSRSVDEYNRRRSHYEFIENDSLSDIVNIDSVAGVYPDSIGDYALTKELARFEGFDITQSSAYREGYNDGVRDFVWHSPWYYTSFGWYDPWMWRSSWYYDWYSPYYGWYGWGYPWYSSWYGWGSPYYYGYYGYWGYGSWGYPYYYGGGGGGHYYASRNGNTGTIDLGGNSRVISHNGSGSGARTGTYRVYSERNSSRMSSLRNRTVGNNSSNRSSSRATRSYNGNFNGGSRMNSSSSSYSSGGGRVSSGGGGSFSSGGGSRSGGSSGGGSRGGRR